MTIKLFRYSGAKTKYLNILIPLIDPNKILIEPFLGSGAVLLNASNQNKIGCDINSKIVDIFHGFKNSNYESYLEFLESTPKITLFDKSSYYDYRDFYNNQYDSLLDYQKAFYQWACINCCVNGMARWGKHGFNQGYGQRDFIKFEQNEFNEILTSLKNTKLECKSFFDLIPLDNRNTVWFLDPPYVSSKNYAYAAEFSVNDATKFIDTIIHLTGDVIYTDVENEYNEQLPNNWTKIELGNLSSTSAHIHSSKKKQIEYAFINFNVKNKLLDF